MGLRPQGGGVVERPVLERLMEKTSPEPMSGRWLWTASVDRFGYGRIFRMGFGADKAHRVAYQELVGPIPGGSCVLHKCDNPACVNPSHLFLGTRDDNNEDMRRKGRKAMGDEMPHRKLSLESAEMIRSIYATDKISMAALAKRFGVSYFVINAVIHNQSWRVS